MRVGVWGIGSEIVPRCHIFLVLEFPVSSGLEAFYGDRVEGPLC